MADLEESFKNKARDVLMVILNVYDKWRADGRPLQSAKLREDESVESILIFGAECYAEGMERAAKIAEDHTCYSSLGVAKKIRGEK